jgi:hypothetical protein
MPMTVAASRFRTHRTVRSLLAALGASLLLTLAFAGSALADSATISIKDTSGRNDPVTGVPRTYTVSGTTSSPKNIYIKYRNPGPTPCGPNASTDSGDWWDDYGDGYNDSRGDGANGSFSFSDVFATGLEGSYMFCIWIADSEDASASPITQMITFRSPSGTISATINPFNPQPGQTATATITGVSEAPETVYANVHSAGTPCAQTYSADVGDSYGDDSTSVNGNFSVTQDVTQSTAGDYVLCLWLADSSSDPTPTAGPQPIPFTVGSSTVHLVTKECRTARHRKFVWTKRVKATKRKLLRAKHRSTRRKLTRRLKKQRHSLKVATRKARVICAS